MKALSTTFFFLPFALLTTLAPAQNNGGAPGVAGGSAAAPSGGGGGGSVTLHVPENYVIKPSDVISFRIFGEPEMTTQVRVSGDGKIALPWIGPVVVSGKSLAGARQAIYELYDRDYFVDPQVEVNVVYFRQDTVEVLGQVLRQGTVPIPSDEKLTLLQAISRAGGWTRLSAKRKVQLQRTQPDGKVKIETINAEKISVQDFPLKKDDIIIVPERAF